MKSAAYQSKQTDNKPANRSHRHAQLQTFAEKCRHQNPDTPYGTDIFRQRHTVQQQPCQHPQRQRNDISPGEQSSPATHGKCRSNRPCRYERHTVRGGAHCRQPKRIRPEKQLTAAKQPANRYINRPDSNFACYPPAACNAGIFFCHVA